MTALVDISAELSARVEKLRLPVGAVRLQPARVRARAARGVPRALGRGDAARGAVGRHEPRAVRHGADGRAVRRRRHGARLSRHHGPVGSPFASTRSGRSRASRASARRSAARGSGAGRAIASGRPSGSSSGSSSRTGARSCSWRSGQEPHPRQAAGRRAALLFRACDEALVEDRRHPAAEAGRRHRRPRGASGERRRSEKRPYRVRPHPSPANPAANNGWPDTSTRGSASSGRAAPRKIASERAPTDVCRADAPHDRRSVGAQPQHHEVHPRGGRRTALVRRCFATHSRGVIFVVLTVVVERTLRVERRHLPVLAFASLRAVASTNSGFVFALDMTNGVDDRPASSARFPSSRGCSVSRWARERAWGDGSGQLPAVSFARRGSRRPGCRRPGLQRRWQASFSVSPPPPRGRRTGSSSLRSRRRTHSRVSARS